MKRIAVALVLAALLSGCAKPPALAPGQAGEFVLSAEPGHGRAWSGPAPIQVFCPRTDLLTCKAEGAFATTSPARLPFTLSPSARPGPALVTVPVRFTYAVRGGAAVAKDDAVPVTIQVRPDAAPGRIEVPLSRAVR